MGVPSGDRAPYWAVRELLNWGAGRFPEIEAEWVMSGNPDPFVAQPLRRLCAVFYAWLMKGRTDDQRRQLDNILSRPPGLTISDMPDIPIPAWMDLDDLPPDMRPEF